jgi:four helix bundle protein
MAEDIADTAWTHVLGWNWFAKRTVGVQLVKAADSVGANLAEGLGRGSAAENRRFAKIARGSLFEVKHWCRRAIKRNLLAEEDARLFLRHIDDLLPRISAYINAIGRPRKIMTE